MLELDVFQLPSRIIVRIFLVMRSRSLIAPAAAPTKYIRVGSPSTHHSIHPIESNERIFARARDSENTISRKALKAKGYLQSRQSVRGNVTPGITIDPVLNAVRLAQLKTFRANVHLSRFRYNGITCARPTPVPTLIHV